MAFSPPLRWQMAATLLGPLFLTLAQAENPFLHVTSHNTATATWSGTEWSDEAGGEAPISAKVETRRVAQMTWGQIVRMRFSTGGKEPVPPLYFLVREEVILQLTDDDMEYLIGVVAAMRTPPRYQPGDIRCHSQKGTHQSSTPPWESVITTTDESCTYLASHPSGHFTKLGWKRGEGLVEYSMGYGAKKNGFRLQAGPPRGDPRSDFDLSGEGFGKFALGLTADQASALLPLDPEKNKIEFQGATGDWIQEWRWPNVGIAVDMVSASEDGPQTVGSIEIRAPSNLKTKRGVAIGDDADAVRSAYGDVLSEEDGEPGKRLVAGSLFGGLIFTLEDGKVAAMFLGAAAE